MTGTDSDPGLSLRVFQDIFRHVKVQKMISPKVNHAITVSYCELYNEILRDLLDPDRFVGDKGLEIRECSEQGIYVKGLSRFEVSSAEEMHKLKLKGSSESVLLILPISLVAKR